MENAEGTVLNDIKDTHKNTRPKKDLNSKIERACQGTNTVMATMVIKTNFRYFTVMSSYVKTNWKILKYRRDRKILECLPKI